MNSGHALNPVISGTERLIAAVRDLSLAKDLDTVCDIVRHAARELTGADGATFVLKEDESCFYADEDAVGPLWKGKRFPLQSCISGWVMTNKTPVVLEDIYSDPRLPHDEYQSTFVKSLAMVPIRAQDPIGAIGNYWAHSHKATTEEMALLQGLADSTSVALESIQVYSEVERRVHERTSQLETINRDLEAFSYSVSHDLRTPLSIILGFSGLLVHDEVVREHPKLHGQLQKIRSAAARMESLIDDLLGLAQVTRSEANRQTINLATLAHEVVNDLQASSTRQVQVEIAGALPAYADAGLMRIVLQNLFSNAWKFTGKRQDARIEFGMLDTQEPVYFVKDNGAGFDLQQVNHVFAPFVRLHSHAQFPGTGIGLAIVQRIIEKHGGAIWAESKVDSGATFFFSLPPAP